MAIDFNAIMVVVIDFFYTHGPKILYALVTLVIGWWLIRILRKFVERRMEKRRVDVSLRHFLSGLISISLKILLLVTVASMIGIATTSFIAILGAAGLAIGLALQGSLANFAGGALILLFKPFRVGDYISAQGFEGTVKKIEIFNTIVHTIDNKVIILPNGSLSNNPITNYSKEKTRRVDITFGISYDDDVSKAIKIIMNIVKKDKRILKDPEPFVRMGELADSSINIKTRVWCKTEDYWDIYFDVLELVKNSFDKGKISIPYPQMDVHMKKK